MRNTRLDKVELYDEHGDFSGHIELARAAWYLAGFAFVRRRLAGVIQAIQLLPSNSTGYSPATLTLRDLLANVGLPCTVYDDARHGAHDAWLSKARAMLARHKVQEYAPVQPAGHPGHIRPALADRLRMVDRLPPAFLDNFLA
jgi:hypothetical protein